VKFILSIGLIFGGYSNSFSQKTSWNHWTNTSTKQWECFVDKIKEKRTHYNDDKVFLKYVFNQVKKNYLFSFQEFSTIEQTLAKEKYNCLTGTALYAYLLQDLGFTFTVKEAHKHVFLLIHLRKESILWESTSIQAGWVDSAEAIRELESKENLKNIDFKQLTGLYWYNLGVIAYKAGNYEEGLAAANKAYFFYSSQKIKKLFELNKKAFWESKMAYNP
jgi:hypothetical protein